MAEPLQTGAVWAPYGLTGNPFFHHPLQAVRGVDRGIHLFRGKGREVDAKKISQRIMNSDNSITLIEGASGIGKTTLASRIKNLIEESEDSAVFPDLIQVDLKASRPLEALAAEILYAAIVAVSRRDAEGSATREAQAEGRGLVLDDLISQKSKIIGLNYIVQAGIHRHQVRREAAQRPFSEWKEAITNVAASAKASGIQRILIHINNLDQSALSDPVALGDLLGHARDLLQTPGFHFLLCGTEAVRTRALGDRPNVKQVLGAPVRPAPLSHGDVAEIVKARYGDLKMTGRAATSFLAPIDPDEAAKVYDQFAGELRSAFECIERVFVEELGPTRAGPRTAAQVLELQRPIFVDLLGTLNDSQFTVLEAVAQLGGKEFKEIRQRDIVGDLERVDPKFSQGYVSQIAEYLVTEGWLAKRQPNAKASYYSLGGRGRIVIRDILEE